jgi:uncharacterized protein YndB with AHSA1/START domain
MLRGILITLAVLVVLILVVVAIGYALPVGHQASTQAVLSQPPERVFAVLTDVEAFPKWRGDLKRVEVLDAGPRKRWRESGSNGDITFEVAESNPPSRLVSRIADTNLAFGGTWTYELAPEGSGTRLTITERGEVYNPLFRFMSRFVFGHTATMEQFLAALAKGLTAS